MEYCLWVLMAIALFAIRMSIFLLDNISASMPFFVSQKNRPIPGRYREPYAVLFASAYIIGIFLCNFSFFMIFFVTKMPLLCVYTGLYIK
jgi:uncharacterized membrane protein